MTVDSTLNLRRNQSILNFSNDGYPDRKADFGIPIAVYASTTRTQRLESPKKSRLKTQRFTRAVGLDESNRAPLAKLQDTNRVRNHPYRTEYELHNASSCLMHVARDTSSHVLSRKRPFCPVAILTGLC